MSHLHTVHDSDAHFTIDPITRAIKNESGKVTVIQHDHNSERFTFSIQKQVDGHDMSACNRVEIHYINIDATDKAQKTTGFYEADDLKTSSDDSGKVTFSWLLSRNATQYAGSLNFLIRFACITDGVEEYAWHTAIFQSITVGSGMYNGGEEVIEPYLDVIAQWKNDLFGVGDTQEQRLLTVSAEQQAAIAAKGAAVLDSIPDEYEELQAQADENTRIKAGAIVLDAEGESIVVNDASDCHLYGLKLFGKSTQNGTPTPDAPVDIVSTENPAVTVCGKNLFNINAITSSGSLTNNGNDTLTALKLVSQPPQKFKEICPHLKVGDVATFSFSSPAVDKSETNQDLSFIYITNAKFSWKNGETKTITQEALDGYVYFYASKDAEGNSVETVISKIQIELGEVATEYEPYIEAQTVETIKLLHGIPVSSGGNYTDADGQQWICDEIDFERGVYVQRVYELVSNYATGWKISGNSTTNHNAFYRMNTTLPTMIKGTNQPVICTHFTMTGDPVADHTICVSGGLSNQEVYFFVPKTEFPDEETWTNYVVEQAYAGTPITTYYILSTPIETPLSEAEIRAFEALHSNKPNTTILNDGSAYMAIEYVADTKTYIDNEIAKALKGSEQV